MITDRVRARVYGAALILFVICAAGLPVQTAGRQDLRKDYALIFGTAWTAQDQPAYGVRIKVRRAGEKKARWELVSDHRGEFAQRVPSGKQDYVIWADVKTGKGKAKPETRIHIENDERVDVSLHLTE